MRSEEKIRSDAPSLRPLPEAVPVEGIVYERWMPFKREDVTLYDEEGGHTSKTWVPGWRYELYCQDDGCPVWDGDGEEIRIVVSRHKPGKVYPERVFYVRQWRDPNGRIFGKTGLRMSTVAAFRTWAAGKTKSRLLEEADVGARRERLRASEAQFLALLSSEQSQGRRVTTNSPALAEGEPG